MLLANQTNNKYVDFISDQDFMHCIENLFNAYENTKNEYTEKQFYKNKIDPIKLSFDMKFNNLSEKEINGKLIRILVTLLATSTRSF